ncbi:MAG: sulfatase-like hydrolase/transferase [bacterium]|nr:sulfatase-like hydrolase/transferase [bacterium]
MRALLSLLALLGFGLTGCSDEPQPRPPLNILLVSLDTTRADHLSTYGHELETSPSLDALARKGHRFARAYTPMPTTLPAHSAMFSSLYPRQIGVLSNLGTLDEDIVTLTEHLGEAGFVTGGFTASQPLAAAIKGETTGFDQGFDHYDDTTSHVRDANVMCGLALDWMKQNAEERFFCFLHMFDAHTDYDAPREHKATFGVEAEEFLPGWTHMSFAVEPDGLTPELVADSVRAYDAELHFADTELGKLLDALEAEGLRENTIVLVVSDHGETLDELIEPYAYAFDHGEFLYPRELHVPFVLWLPAALGIEGGAVHEQEVDLLDVMPTLLDLAGVAPPELIEGRSLVPLLEGDEVPGRTLIAERHPTPKPQNDWMKGPEYALVRDGWLSVHSTGRGEELFDLSRDPQAVNNLRASDPERFEKMRARVEKWLEVKLPVYGAEAAKAGSARDKALEGIGYTQGG